MDPEANAFMPPLLPIHRPTLHYHSYLVRLWPDDDLTTWHALAQSVQTGEIHHFVDLNSLFTFLQAQTGVMPNAKPHEPTE